MSRRHPKLTNNPAKADERRFRKHKSDKLAAAFSDFLESRGIKVVDATPDNKKKEK